MADRNTKVTLTAQVTQYIAGMEQASKKTRDLGSAAEKLAAQKEAFGEIGRASLAIGALAAAGVALAVTKFAEFDQAMSFVQAATHETTENMGALREAALEAGASTVFSATESANAIEEMGKAGVSTADILNGGLKGALSLAAAGGIGVAEAAGIAATALKQFNLQGFQMEHVADLLAAGAGKAMGDVTDLSAALSQSGLVAANTGLSIEETTGTLAAFASQSLLGSDAGTSFKSMLQRLTPQSAEAREKMEELGISAYDAAGNFIGMEKFAGNLRTSLIKLTPEQRNSAMATIFGADAVRAATVLYDEGAVGIGEWIDAVDDQGYAAETAAARLDNLAGDIEALGGAFDTALIQTGSAANDSLRFMAQAITNVVDAYNDLGEPVKAAVLIFGGLTAAVGISAGAFMLGVPKVAAYQAALATLGPAAQKAGAAVSSAAGPIGLAFVAASVAIGIFIGKQAEATGRIDAVTDSLDAQTGAITENTRKTIAKRLEDQGVLKEAKLLGLNLDDVTDAAMGNAEAHARVTAALEEYRDKGGTARAAIGNIQNAIGDQNAELETSKGKFERQQEALEGSTEATDDNASALEAMSSEAADAGDVIDELAETIRNFGSGQLDVNAATRSYEQAVDDLSESIAENGKTLKLTEQAGRDNSAALDDVAKSSLELAAATLEQTGSQVEANAVIASGRARLIEMLGTLGITGAKAEAYADKLGLIPDNVYTAVSADTAAAQRKIDNFIILNSGRKVRIAIEGQSTTGGITKADGGIVDYYANGGLRENHTAEIAPAGSWRVWAEPETGGEAYIPLAAAKRARSLEIWEQTGKRLGVAGYASGYISQPQYGSSGSYSPNAPGATPAFNVVVTSKGGVDLLRYVDVQIEQAGNASELKYIRGRQS